jgi:ABC-2 type transport system permease protein
MTVVRVLGTEFGKLRRSRVTWLTLVAMSLAPIGTSFFLWIQTEPERAARLGLLGAKAQLSGLTPDWQSMAATMTLFVGIGGTLLLTFVIAYVFGREYTDGTVTNMFLLPVARHWFVLAKLGVVAAWWLALVGAVLAEAALAGLLMGLPGWSAELAVAGTGHVLAAAGMTYLLGGPVAWITTAGRGYLPPLGFALTMLLIGNLLVRTGWAAWFPWSIVPLSIGTVAQPAAGLSWGSYTVVGATFLVGTAATVLQTRYADNAQ